MSSAKWWPFCPGGDMGVLPWLHLGNKPLHEPTLGSCQWDHWNSYEGSAFENIICQMLGTEADTRPFGHFEQCHLPLSSTKIFKSKPFTCLMTSCNDPYPGQLYLDSPSHIRDRLRQATTTVDETVCLFNRGFSPQTVQNRLQESNLYTHLLRRGLVLTLAWRLQRLAWVRGHTCWTLLQWGMCSSMMCPVSSLTEEMGGSMCGATQGSRMLTSPSYSTWHTATEAHWFWRAYPMDIAHNCMSLLVIWMLSDTTMKICARGSCPLFARTTPFPSMTTPDLTSPASV